jgi:hypothetical protein
VQPEYLKIGGGTMKKAFAPAVVLATFVLAACTQAIAGGQAGIAENRAQTVSDNETSGDEEIQVTSDGVKYIVHPSKLLSGGPPPDGIPSIDNPQYISVLAADAWIDDDELVTVLVHKGVKRVYPFQILVWHEIVNDTVEGDPILVTYCPLCGSAIAFERTLDGEGVEFGTSGRLYNSNLVMYDRRTRTFWTQIGGQAIVGERTGEKLKPISIDTVTWGDWKSQHPDSEVLSRETGHSRPYGADSYEQRGYYRDERIWFPVENRDTRVHSKTVIFGIELNGEHKAYAEDDLIREGSITDTFAGVDLRVDRDEIGIVTITNLDTGEEIVKERDFWFAWAAFHPETELYGN